MNSVAATAIREVFNFYLDQPITINNLIFDNNTNGGAATTTFDGRKNGAQSRIHGLTKVINVINSLDWRDGQLTLGQINYQGLNATFRCDAISNSDRCADLSSSLNIFSLPESMAVVGVRANTTINFNRNDGFPQTYTFDDGAAAPGFIINNPNGVNPTQNGVAGYFRLGRLHVYNGVFVAPTHLSFNEGSDTQYLAGGNATLGFEVTATGTYIHNNGLVSFDAVNTYNDSRAAISISSTNPLILYDVTLNVAGDYLLVSPGTPDQTYVYISDLTNILVQGNLNIQNGYFHSNFGSSALISIFGDFNLLCSNPANKVCYYPSFRVNFEFVSNQNTTLYFEPGGLGAISSFNANITLNKTLSTNTLTLLSDGAANLGSSSVKNFNIINGTFNLQNFQFFHNSNLINNGIVNCTAPGYFQYGGTLSGTPQPGNNPTCYGP